MLIYEKLKSLKTEDSQNDYVHIWLKNLEICPFYDNIFLSDYYIR